MYVQVLQLLCIVHYVTGNEKDNTDFSQTKVAGTKRRIDDNYNRIKQ